MKYFRVALTILIVIVVIVAVLLHKKDLYLFSPVKGVVTLNGKPLSRVSISQSAGWSWTQENFTQEAKTDSEGTFMFPPIIAHSGLASILPAQIIVLQTIRIEYEGKVYSGFMYEKTNYDKFSELGGTSFNLVCELTNKKDHFRSELAKNKEASSDDQDTAYGVCRMVRMSKD